MENNNKLDGVGPPDWIQGYMYTLGRRGLRVSWELLHENGSNERQAAWHSHAEVARHCEADMSYI